MSLITKHPSLTLKQQANNSNRPSPRWSLQTQYSDWTVELEIEHHFGRPPEDDGYKTWLWVDGECFEMVTQKELKDRVETAESHGDVYDVSQVHAVRLDDGLMRVKAELISRWEAIQFIVSPSINH